ncbi:MAG: c-type cytochrome biogenesis protein CcmI [Gammaproteobacteria bacterium]|nr:c-type cytochrome biogenesis protein CcmI [Gammaproteobacteria bacterium]
MNEYWGMVAVLLALASLFALWPLLRPVSSGLQQTDSHRADNISLFQQQQQDMQADLAAGNLTATEYAEREAELERALLDDLQAQESRPNINNRGAYLLLSTALLIPVAGWFMYAELGAGNGLQQRENMQITRSLMQTSQNREQLLTELQAHLQDNPNNPEGWFILANYYMQNQQSQKGLQAFQQAKQYAPLGSRERAAILGQYAQALFFVDGTFSHRVSDAISETMAVDPNDVSALSLLGIQAFEADKFAAAIRFWEQAVAGSTNGEGTQSLQAGISNARLQLAQQQGDTAGGPVIEVSVRLANGLQVPSDPATVLFVYALKAGQSMPVLATRIDPHTLPTTLQLTNAMVLLPDTNLADFAQLDIVAHMAKAGTPKQNTGDLVGKVNSVSVAAKEVVDLALDRIVSGQ